MAGLRIRRYQREDATAVRRLSPAAPPLQEVQQAGGEAWVAERGGRVVAYAFAAPLPGLPGQFDLSGCVAPDERRQGIGSQLLKELLSVLKEQDVQQVSCAVEQLDGPAARFLQARDFYLHHEEWRMVLPTLEQLPPRPTVPGCEAQTLSRRRAISTFRRLYDQSFAGMPWYQPYTEDEVDADLQQAEDLLFWVCSGEAVGFIWVRDEGSGGVEIEPVGLLPTVRGRGYGRALLLTALHRAAQGRRWRQSASQRRVHLAVWRENNAAIELYRQLGFERSGCRYYLAYDLDQHPVGA